MPRIVSIVPTPRREPGTTLVIMTIGLPSPLSAGRPLVMRWGTITTIIIPTMDMAMVAIMAIMVDGTDGGDANPPRGLG